MKMIIVATVLAMAASALFFAQHPHHQSPGRAYVFLGLGWGESAVLNGPPLPPQPLGATHPVIERFGGGGELFLYKGLGTGLDVGYSRYGRYADEKFWVGTGDLSYQFGRNASRGKVDPFVLAGFGGFIPASQGRGTPCG